MLQRTVRAGRKLLPNQRNIKKLRHSAAFQQTTQGSNDDSRLWVKSPFPDVQTVIGIEAHELIYSKLPKIPANLVAFECAITGKKLTFGEIYKHSRAFAVALKQSGLKPGDIVGVVLPNIPEFSVVLLGCWGAGLTPSCVNPAYTEEEIKRQLAISKAKSVITIDHFLQAVRSAKTENQDIKSIIIIGEGREGCHTYSEMIKCDPTGVELSSGSKAGRDTTEDLALLPFSSGTTGPPKGVMLTHTNITTNLMQYLPEGVAITRDFTVTGRQERLLGLLPFFHSYGCAAFTITGVFQGAHTICLPRFDPNTFLDAIRQHKPTTMHLVTPLLNHIVNSNDFTAKEFEETHSVVGAAAPIGKVLIEKVLKKAGKYIFFAEGYGMTELSPLTHMLSPTTRNTKSGSCGTCVPSTVCKVIDTKTGETLGPNCNGEILIRGPQVMKGYFNNEEATRNTLDPEGWLHTGDVGYYDEEGFFYIVDRLKELIKVKGFQVAPSELEDILRKHDKVQDVAVIGIPHEESGEVPRAYIVKKDETLTEIEVHEYLKPHVASFKQLKGGIEFRQTIPKAPSGKILRRELVQEYKQKLSS